MAEGKERSARSLVELVRELPQLLLALVRAELGRLKRELIHKAKHAAIGIAFFAAAAAIALLLLPVLITAAILGLAVVVPGWAAALIVAAAMVVVIGALAIAGVLAFRRMGGAAPRETIDGVKSDVDAVKGMGEYDF